MTPILSCKCTVLCYILEYIYMTQIIKRRNSPVFAFNMQIPRSGRMFGRVLHVQSKHINGASLCYLYNIDIFSYTNRKIYPIFTKQYIYKTKYAYSIILEFIPMYTFASEEHVCIRDIWNSVFKSPRSSVGRASDDISQGCGFESHCGLEFFILYFVAFDAHLKSTGPIQMKSSIMFIQSILVYVHRKMIIWQKNGGGCSS